MSNLQKINKNKQWLEELGQRIANKEMRLVADQEFLTCWKKTDKGNKIEWILNLTTGELLEEMPEPTI